MGRRLYQVPLAVSCLVAWGYIKVGYSAPLATQILKPSKVILETKQGQSPNAQENKGPSVPTTAGVLIELRVWDLCSISAISLFISRTHDQDHQLDIRSSPAHYRSPHQVPTLVQFLTINCYKSCSRSGRGAQWGGWQSIIETLETLQSVNSYPAAFLPPACLWYPPGWAPINVNF